MLSRHKERGGSKMSQIGHALGSGSLAALMIVVTILYGGTVTVVSAGWSNDPNVNAPVCTAGNAQEYPAIISGELGSVIITWEDSRIGSDDIYAQRVTGAGEAAWASNGVGICTYGNAQSVPRIASDGAGGGIIIWNDYRSVTTVETYAQRVAGGGAIQWKATGVPVSASGTSFQGAILSDDLGGAFIVWTGGSGGNYNIYAQRLSASGDTLWTRNGVPVCTAPNDQTYPVILSDGAGGFIVAWQDCRTDQGDIYAQRIDASGARQWAASGVIVCGSANGQFGASMVSDGAGSAIIAWEDTRSGNVDIYAQRIDGSGSLQWVTGGSAICVAPNGQGSLRMAGDGMGGAIITWADQRKSFSDSDIYAQRISGVGEIQWTANGVALTQNGDSYGLTAIVSDGEGGAIIAWEDYRHSPPFESNIDIYARRVDAAGLPQWVADGVAVSTAPGHQRYPQVVTDGASGAIITWQDYRNGNWDIYVQNVDSSGALGSQPMSAVIEPENPDVVSAESSLRLTGANPCRIGQPVELGYDIPWPGAEVSIVAVDIAGRQVDALVERAQGGDGTASWDTAGKAPGIYFLRMEAGAYRATKKVVLLR
jgi:hypothetical protein